MSEMLGRIGRYIIEAVLACEILYAHLYTWERKLERRLNKLWM